jgi:probable phosphoglycerate mutase
MYAPRAVELLLIRHALPVRLVVERGRADPHLAPQGREQAVALARWLSHERIDAFYASPLRRAVETAGPLAASVGVDTAVRDGLAEWDRDADAYIPVEELKADDHPLWRALAGGRWHELGIDPVAFLERVVTTIDGVAAAHPGERVAVVCHGGVINAYTGNVLGVDRLLFFEPDYTSISRILVSRDGRRSLRSLNEAPHLRPDPT